MRLSKVRHSHFLYYSFRCNNNTGWRDWYFDNQISAEFTFGRASQYRKFEFSDGSVSYENYPNLVEMAMI